MGQRNFFQVLIGFLMRVLLVTRVWGTSFDASNPFHRMVQRRRWVTAKTLVFVLVVELSILIAYLGVIAEIPMFRFGGIIDELMQYYLTISLFAVPLYYSFFAAIIVSRVRRDYLKPNDVEQLRISGISDREVINSAALPVVFPMMVLLGTVSFLWFCYFGYTFFQEFHGRYMRIRVFDILLMGMVVLYIFARFLGGRLCIDAAAVGAVRAGFGFSSYSPVRIIVSALIFIGWFLLGVYIMTVSLNWNGNFWFSVFLFSCFFLLAIISVVNGNISKKQMDQLLARIGDEE